MQRTLVFCFSSSLLHWLSSQNSDLKPQANLMLYCSMNEWFSDMSLYCQQKPPPKKQSLFSTGYNNWMKQMVVENELLSTVVSYFKREHTILQCVCCLQLLKMNFWMIGVARRSHVETSIFWINIGYHTSIRMEFNILSKILNNQIY